MRSVQNERLSTAKSAGRNWFVIFIASCESKEPRIDPAATHCDKVTIKC